MATRSYAAAAIGLLLLVAGCDSDVAKSGEGPATSLQGCPAAPDQGTDKYDEPYADLPDEVPEGAIAARMCPGGGSAMEVPQDVLEVDVASLVDTINEQPDQAGNECTSDGGPGYRILFDYPDDSTFLVSAGFYGCDSVVVGSGYREGPDAVLRAFQDLVVAQRAELEPPSPAIPGDLTCGGSGSAPDVPTIGSPQDAVRAVLCRVKSRDRVIYYSAPIGRIDLRGLLDDLAAERDPGSAHCEEKLPYSSIVATNAWGDRIEIAGECRASVWRLFNDDELWRPGPEAQAILERLVSEARRVPVP